LFWNHIEIEKRQRHNLNVFRFNFDKTLAKRGRIQYNEGESQRGGNVVHIAVCDDDKRERDTIEQYISEQKALYPEVQMDVSSFGSGEDLLAACRDKTRFDLLFLDIQKYIIENESQTVVLEIKDIVYIESDDHYMHIYTEEKEYLKRGNLNDEEKALAPYGFVRIHRKCLVNMAFVFEVTQNLVTLKNGSPLKLSARKRGEVMSCLNQFLAGCSICLE
jgi:DNA-binding LytR/AlgR family response regulator